MLYIKTGAIVHGNQYTNAIMEACQRAYASLDVTITSGNDSQHGKNSLHYVDRALDVRFWSVKDKDAMAAMIRGYLPKSYDVVVEKDHFHIEADPKKE